MSEVERATSAFFYAGPDERMMIDALIRAAPARLKPGGRSMTNLPANLALMRQLGLEPRIVAKRTLEILPFINGPGWTNWGALRAGSTRCATAILTRLHVV